MVASAGSGVRGSETRYARLVDGSSRGLTIDHLRLFLNEVDKVGLPGETAVRIIDKLHPSDTWHDVEINASLTMPIKLEEIHADATE